MKLLVAVIFAALLIIFAVTPALAFTPPESSDNATNVILWYGDNLTLTIDAGNVTITDLTDSIDEAAQTLTDGLVEVFSQFFDDLIGILSQFFAFIVVAAFVILAYKRESLFLQIIASPLVIVYGLVGLAIPAEPNSIFWVAGLVIAVFGTSMLFKIIYDVLIRKRKPRPGGG